MEEKNLASEMINKMKRYVQGEKEEVTEAEKKPEVVVQKPSEKKVRQLPKEESLFEFDGFVFDDADIPAKPTLTGEEAELADELTEKFGVSKNVGVGFIDESEQDAADEPIPAEMIKGDEVEVTENVADFEEDVAVEEPITADEISVESTLEEESELSETYGSEQDAETVDAFVTPSFEALDVQPEIAEQEKADEVSEITDKKEAYAQEFDDEEPEQVTFYTPVSEPEPTIPEVLKPLETPIGIQLTFLDAEEVEEEEPFVEPEQMTLEENADTWDTDTDEATSVDGDSVLDYPDAEVSEGETVGTEPSAPVEYELTPIEIAAIEEEQRLVEEEPEPEIEVQAEEFDEDVWDAQDRAIWSAKKRYSDYCASLVVPPIKVTKEVQEPKNKEQEALPSSGYRYEMTERLPIFADGINGGKNTDSYFSREIEYCEERETKRSGQLLDKMRATWRKTIFSFALMLTVILLENINVFFGQAPDKLLTPKNVMLFSIIDIVLLLVGAFFIADAIKDGLKFAFKGVFIPESLTAGVLILAVIYHAALLVVGASSQYAILFGTSASVSMFLCALYRYNMLRREYIVFSVASSYGSYTTEVKMLGFRNSPEGRAFDGYADVDASLYKLNNVSRIDGCYVDKPVRDECYGILRKLALCIVCAAVVSGVVFGIIKRDVFYGLLSALSLVSLSAPVSVFVAAFLLRLRTATVSAEAGGALVDFDDESDEFDESVIMIDDGELFPPEKLISSGFEMQRSPGIELHLARTLALFKKIGGTLAAVFKNVDSGELESCKNVSIIDVTEHGVAAKIDGRIICAGSENFLKKYGVKVKRYDKLLPKNGRVMYIADDGVFFARAILTFKPNEELVKKISELRNTNTLFSLKTCNPCIDRELLFYTTGLEPELVRLIKYQAGDDVSPSETDREGSIVSKNGALGFVTALLEYKRQKKLMYVASRFACVACGVGAFVSLLTSAVGINFGFSSLVSAALHGVLSAAAFFIAGRSAINTKSKIKKQ